MVRKIFKAADKIKVSDPTVDRVWLAIGTHYLLKYGQREKICTTLELNEIDAGQFLPSAARPALQYLADEMGRESDKFFNGVAIWMIERGLCVKAIGQRFIEEILVELIEIPEDEEVGDDEKA